MNGYNAVAAKFLSDIVFDKTDPIMTLLHTFRFGNPDMSIDDETGAHFSGTDIVWFMDSLNGCDTRDNTRQFFCIDRTLDKLRQAPGEYLPCGLENEDTYNCCGKGIENGPFTAQKNSNAGSNTCSYRREGIAAVMPGVCNQGRGVNLCSDTLGNTIQNLLCNNGNDSCDKCEPMWPGKNPASEKNPVTACQAVVPKLDANTPQKECDKSCRQGFEFSVSEWMVFVDTLFSDMNTNENNDVCNEVRCRVYRIGKHCLALAPNTGGELCEEEEDV